MGRVFLLFALFGGILFAATSERQGGFSPKEYVRRPLAHAIEALEPWGCAVFDRGGARYFHDRLAPGRMSHDINQRVAYGHWGQYPLYYAGTKMRYQIILRNQSRQTYRRLRVSANHEYLGLKDQWNPRAGAEFTKNWFLQEIAGGEIVVLTAEVAIPLQGTGFSLNQIHLQVEHTNEAEEGIGTILVDDARQITWCPPDFKP